MKNKFTEYINANNLQGSNKANSYIRAIELLEDVLKSSKGIFAKFANIWEIQSVSQIADLYLYIKEQQSLFKKGQGIFVGHSPKSYWNNGFCSAALKAYKEFLIIMPYEEKMWKLYSNIDAPSAKIAKQLLDEKLIAAENLIDETTILSTKEGKDTLRTVKARVNQQFFRKMILKSYNNSCCITGLNIPEVLRASHIVAWADDKKNRLNPENGLCLSATYDAAFDRHLISFDDDYRMILAPSLKEYYSNDGFKLYFKNLEGHQITLPTRFTPDIYFLEQHRDKLK